METLRATGSSPEQRRPGQGDTVMNPEGRTVRLRRAQDQLRHDDATKQAAILNALPAHIALLDAQGFIISVNEAWRQFADANALHGPAYGVGLNYLGVCSSVHGDGAAQAQQMAAGIRSVLAGGQTNFSLEYPCHSPTEQRWFLAMVTPLAADPLNGAVVTHLSITERKKTEQKFKDLLEAAPDAMVIVNRDAEIVLVNFQAVQLFGWRRDELLGQKIEILVPVRLRGKHSGNRNGFFAQPQARAMGAGPELLGRRKDGSEFPIELGLSPMETDEGTLVISAIRDITERKQAQARIVRLNRVYAVLSGTNALIVRVRDRDDLFREACRIAVDAGAFKMAWIGVLEPHSLDGRVVAWYGCEQDFIDQIKLTVRDDARDDERPACRALRLGRPVICNDIATEPSLAALKEELVGRGYLALGSFPLTVAGRPEAVFALFAGESGFFDDEETGLLVELAANLSFAMDNLEKEKRLEQLDAQRTLDEQALRRFSSAMDATADAIYLVDRASMRFIHVNDAACRMLGQTRKQLLALGPAALLSTSRAELEFSYDALIASGTNAAPVELLRQRQNGSQAWIELRRHALRSGERWTIVTLARDITERKQAQSTLAEQLGELRRWSDVTVGREGRILDLKHEVNELLTKAGLAPRYPSAES